ncbi:hypothetical protein Tco_0454275 [Tanacetum coccineum]
MPVESNNEDEGKHDYDPVFSKVGEDSQKEPKLGLDDDDDDDLGNLAFELRAKRIALYQLKQNVGSQYDMLVDYATELIRSNPRTTVCMQVDPIARAWRKAFAPQLLFENIENWEWFMKALKKDLDLCDGSGVTLISDGHKGLIQEVKRILPNVEHRLCARHIYANFSKQYVNVEAHKYLMDKEPWTWSMAFFNEGMDYDAVENGLSEPFNSHIKIARRKPIIGMLEDIRSYVMQMNDTLRRECEKWQDKLCSNIRKVLELYKQVQRYAISQDLDKIKTIS